MLDHLVGIIGPVLLLAVSSAGLAMVRTRTNAHRISELEKTVEGLETLAPSFARLEERVEANRRQAEERARTDRRIAEERASENRDDHGEIKQLIRDSEGRMIAEIRRNGNATPATPGGG